LLRAKQKESYLKFYYCFVLFNKTYGASRFEIETGSLGFIILNCSPLLAINLVFK